MVRLPLKTSSVLYKSPCEFEISILVINIIHYPIYPSCIILNHPNPETEFWLGHLSKENNSPGLASLTVNYILKYGKGQKKRFKVLPRKAIGYLLPLFSEIGLQTEIIEISKEKAGNLEGRWRSKGQYCS
ncbi:MAG: hypothetical protein COY75_09570 [Nitrospirae bacterium CG_4_10_14_0_8_um_filter_41_23]|nr:hypothetical protein [Nitrospirota bacterium]PIV41199.1 MAG: hypothetical protein COS27_10450 [Nitrospirae bacterium CG02_land_8_20_14_3_00_41_53]PIW88090.1 MAG: hypothetical protein COZ94_01625 [Nitrospirae bacterium CG_4_8_14_3_um_filter_41_47]PIY86150.1 MAG: hypothetical protein COY75_09570 [Nitrospirae bacterium CG_4_10_14_0_8_um_filter_41_23]PJA80525.1 MAG: hypothetical protein CO148_02875 [Nitrospirae bacterium CG_4_9_14_3_um_filter_41_27]